MVKLSLFSSMVVAAATDVAVLNGRLVRHGLRAIGPGRGVVAQDRSDRTVATGANIDAALAGRLRRVRHPRHAPTAGCRCRRGSPVRDAALACRICSTRAAVDGPITVALTHPNRAGVQSA